jgi:EpsI family protein
MVHGLIWITDVPAYVEGNNVFLGVGTFVIAGGCSGLSFILAGLSLAVLYGHLYYSSWQQKIILVAATTFLAMLGNWIRVFAIIVIGHESEMQSSLIDDHLTFGWILFGILMIPILFLAQNLERSRFGSSIDSPLPVTAVERPQRTQFSSLALLATLGVLAVGPVWALVVASADSGHESVSLQFPEAPNGWRGPSSPESDWRPIFVGASAEQVVAYKSGTEAVLAYSNVYLTQAQAQEPIYYANDIKGHWLPNPDTKMPSLVTAGPAGTFRQVNARNSYGKWMIWYRYTINNKPVTSELQGKLMQAIATLRGTPEAGVIAFASQCQFSCEKTQSLLAGFVSALGDEATVRYKTEVLRND